MSAANLTPDPATPGTTPTGAGYPDTSHTGMNRRDDRTGHDHLGRDESLTGKGIAIRTLGVLVAIALVTWIAAALTDDPNTGFMDLYWWILLGGVTGLIVDFVLNKALKKKS